jgi:predicted secreted protein
MIALSNVLSGVINGHWNNFEFNLIGAAPSNSNDTSNTSSTDIPSSDITINGLFILANAEEEIDFIQLQELNLVEASVQSFSTTEKRKF